MTLALCQALQGVKLYEIQTVGIVSGSSTICITNLDA